MNWVAKLRPFLKEHLIPAAVFFVIILIIVGVNLINLADEPKQYDDTPVFEDEKPLSPPVISKEHDYDDDGLSSSLEEVLGTDPYAADTDGDGFLDGEEVERGFSPLIKTEDDPNGFKLPYSTTATVTLDVAWEDTLYEIGQHAFDKGRLKTTYDEKIDYSGVKTYRVGKITGGMYDGFFVITQLVSGMGTTKSMYIGAYNTSTHQYDPVYQIRPDYYQPQQLDPWTITVEFNDLAAPELIPISGSTINLVKDTWGIQSLGSPSKSEPLMTYRGDEVRIISGSQCPYILQDDFSVASYHWDVDFTSDNGVLDVTFLDGTKNQYQYDYRNLTCGDSCTLYTFADLDTYLPQEDFVIAGYASDGRTYYELKNAQHPVLWNMFNDPQSAYKYQSPDLTYEDLLASHPLLFWKDPLGRWIEFKGRQFLPAAEKCKPLIYLYPEEETIVQVQVEPVGGMTASYPQYPDNGWKVRAYPDGTLIDLETNHTFSSLFWEGKGTGALHTQEGFVIAQTDLQRFLKNTMAGIGFNGQEISEFLHYWLPRLQEYPFYGIRFHTQQEINTSAPLTIRPQPETVIRMFVDFQGLYARAQWTPQTLPVFERNGFTVTEWGGSMF